MKKITKFNLFLIGAVLAAFVMLPAGPAFTAQGKKLPLDCAQGEVAKWDEAMQVWICAEDIDTTTDISALETQVNTNKGDIGTNTTAISTNTDTITDLEDLVLDLENRVRVLEACAANRYTDQGDGTILDCNTQLVWLKDASCADLAGTDTFGRAADWDTAEDAAAALADGTCNLTDGSEAGDWRQPTIAEFCSAWAGSTILCPSGNADNSLIDSSVGPPTVVNTAGDDVWTEGDPFLGVQSFFYWSATRTGTGANNVSFADLFSGSLFVPNPNEGINFAAYVWPVRGGQ